MKKIISLIGLTAVFTGAMAQSSSQNPQTSVYTTNVTTTTGPTVHFISSNRMNIRQIMIANSASSPVLVEVFDVNSISSPWNGTNDVLSSYVSRDSYETNVATSFIDSGGNTNYYTNVYRYTYNVTNAAASNSTPKWVGAVGGSQAVLFNTDILNPRTTAIRVSTNCSVIIYYNRGQ